MSEVTEVSTPAETGNAEAEPVEAVGGESETPAPEVGTPATPEEKARVQERINKLTRARYESEQRAEQSERELQRLRAELDSFKAKPQQVAPAEDKFPTLEEYGYDEGKYAEAMKAYFRAPAIPDEDQLVDKALEKYEQRVKDQERKSTWDQRQADFVKAKPDFVEKVYRHPTEGGPVITEDMLEVITESDLGPMLAYHLAENPEVSEQIARLPPKLQARELGRIEARLESAKAAAVAKPVVSSAPPPVATISVEDSVRSVSTTDPASDKLSDSEWVKAERKRVARKASR